MNVLRDLQNWAHFDNRFIEKLFHWRFGKQNINALAFLSRRNKINFKKITITKTSCILMMTSILHGWQQAFSNNYRRSSKILITFHYLETKNICNNWKPRKNLKVSIFFLPINWPWPRRRFFLHTLYVLYYALFALYSLFVCTVYCKLYVIHSVLCMYHVICDWLNLKTAKVKIFF